MSTLFTFNASVRTSGSRSAPVEPGSPVLAPDEIFSFAGWGVGSSNSSQDDANALFSAAPYPFDFQKAPELSEEAKLRLRKSNDDYSRMVLARQDFEKKLADLSAPDTKEEASDNVAVKALMDAAEESIMHIPKSYEEIYSISVKNRQKNKDKKRGRGDDDAGGAGEEAESSGVSGEAQNFDHLKGSEYFSEVGTAVATDVDSTLEFARQIGWVSSAERAASLKETHLREVADQQQSGEGEGGVRDSTGSLSSSKSFQQPNKKSNTGGAVASVAGPDKGKVGAGGSSSGGGGGGGGSSSGKFEYPKYGASNALGALPPKSATADPLRGSNDSFKGSSSSNGGGGGGSSSGKNNKNRNSGSNQPFRVKAESVNPYMGGAAQFNEK